MKTTLSKIALVGTGFFAAHLVYAQASAAAATSITSEDASGQKVNIFKTLDNLKTQKVLLSAQLENAKLQKQLDDVRSGKDPAGQTGNSAPGGQYSPAPSMGSLSSVPSLPVEPKGATVQLVSSSPKVNSGAPTATIGLPSGRIVTAVVGTKVPGLGTITVVSAEQVIYRRADGHEAGLPFVSESDSGGH